MCFNLTGKEYSQEILARDDAFSFAKAFHQKFPGDALLKNLGTFSPTKLLKDYILCKLNFYSERMQKSLYSATQKHIDIGDHDEPKVINNMYQLMTKIISTPIANIFMGEVNIYNTYCIFFLF
jgi:hypothetical protein